MTLTRDQLLDLLLLAAQCAERMDQDLTEKYGIIGPNLRQQVCSYEIRQLCPDSAQITWQSLLDVLRSPQTSSKAAEEGHRLA